jgi:hypothetical protein
MISRILIRMGLKYWICVRNLEFQKVRFERKVRVKCYIKIAMEDFRKMFNKYH